jgi:hypothetical protein
MGSSGTSKVGKRLGVGAGAQQHLMDWFWPREVGNEGTGGVVLCFPETAAVYKL